MEFVIFKESHCKKFRRYKNNTNTIIVVFDVGIFDYERVCYIIREDIDNFFSMEKITSSCIVLYMR